MNVLLISYPERREFIRIKNNNYRLNKFGNLNNLYFMITKLKKMIIIKDVLILTFNIPKFQILLRMNRTFKNLNRF